MPMMATQLNLRQSRKKKVTAPLFSADACSAFEATGAASASFFSLPYWKFWQSKTCLFDQSQRGPTKIFKSNHENTTP